MASIERTAYPRFKRNPTLKELRNIYSITPEENQFAHRVAKGAVPVLSLLIMLKSFQRLGYFPRPKDIPEGVINNIRECLNLSKDIEPNFQSKSLYRHQKAIRDYLNVHPYSKETLHIATSAIHQAAQVMDNPADLINVAIEELIKERCELPAFSTLDRLVRRIRTLVNYRLFNTVLSRLSFEDQQKIDRLLETSDGKRITEFNYLKEPPKSPTLSHMKDVQDKLAWLSTFIWGVDHLLMGVPNSKIKHFAAEARVLDASELKDFALQKRYTLMLCMLYRFNQR